MELFDAVMKNPYLAPAVLAFGAGVAVMWKALVAMVVRILGQVASEHDDDDDLVVKVKEFKDHSTIRGRMESAAVSWVPSAVVKRQVVKHKENNK